MTCELHILPDVDALAHAAATHWRETAAAAIRQHERFSIALAGGDTPVALYRLLAAEPEGIDWPRVWVYFGDERCVPPDHADSNYRMAHKTLLGRVPVPPAQIFRMACEADPARAAEDYAARLAPLQPAADLAPVFDLVLLGLGADGHTASLFPGSAALEEKSHWVAASFGGPPQHPRLTLTLPVLNATREVMMLVSGRNKAAAVRAALDGKPEIPAARLRPAGTMHWFLDTAAAALLESGLSI